jgi:hypothetical protein
MSLPFGLNTVTKGLARATGSTLPQFPQLVGGGLPVLPPRPLPKPNTSELAPPLITRRPSINGLPTSSYLDLDQAAKLRDVSGDVVVPSAFGFVNLGKGHTLEFDDTTQQGRISPSLSGRTLGDLDSLLGGAPVSFTGSDLRIMLEIANPPTSGNSSARFSKQLLECTTMTVSVHREKAPARAAGYVNPKGFARGKRTIAGTIILTQFTAEVLMRFLQGVLIGSEASKDSQYAKVDQIPPFNMTMFFSNELGYASYRRLLGVEMVTDGVVYSTNDLMTEQTISYMASDFTPLLPLTATSLWHPGTQDRRRDHEKTVQDVWDALIPLNPSPDQVA